MGQLAASADELGRGTALSRDRATHHSTQPHPNVTNPPTKHQQTLTLHPNRALVRRYHLLNICPDHLATCSLAQPLMFIARVGSGEGEKLSRAWCQTDGLRDGTCEQLRSPANLTRALYLLHVAEVCCGCLAATAVRRPATPADAAWSCCAAFDEAWVTYLEQFAAWKLADAATLEVQLVTALLARGVCKLFTVRLCVKL